MELAPRITSAALDWDNDQPVSRQYQDVYYIGDGMPESLRVFCELNNLTQRFASLKTGSTFKIAEIGFGTGLNFLCAQRLFQAHAPAGCTLHYISFEARPLLLSDLQRVRRHESLRSLNQRLLDSWPPLTPGWHRRYWQAGIRLSLYFGDALQGLESLAHMPQGIHAWFLDGFAPDRNPLAWQPELFTHMARHSHPGASLATFSAAGAVRKSATDAGFEVMRVDARPFKKHYLKGRFKGTASAVSEPPRAVQILGAGLAGSSLAQAFSQRGIDAQLFDQTGGIGGASQNPAAVLHTRLVTNNPVLAQLRLEALAYSSHWLNASGLPQIDQAWYRLGALERPGPSVPEQDLPQLAAYLAEVWPAIEIKDAKAATVLSKVTTYTPALWFSHGGYADMGKLCRAVSNANDPSGNNVRRLEIEDSYALQNWIRDFDGISVIAAGTGSMPFAPILRKVAGSIDVFQLQHAENEHDQQNMAPRSVVTGNGYIVPLQTKDANGVEIASGATYERDDQIAGIPNSQRMEEWLISHANDGQNTWRHQRSFRAYRTISPDRTPLAGPLTGFANTWLNTGYGSSALAFAPITAEHIVSELCGEPPVSSVAHCFDPGRFKAMR